MMASGNKYQVLFMHFSKKLRELLCNYLLIKQVMTKLTFKHMSLDS